MQVKIFHLKDIDQRWKRNIFAILRILIWLVLTRLCVYVSLHGENLLIKSGDVVWLAFIMFPFLFLGAFYGYVLSYVSFIIAFIITYIMSMDTAYNMIIYLVAVSSFSLFSQYFWFKTIKKTLLTAAYTTIFVALAEYACYTVIKNENYSISSLLGIFMYIAASALEIFAVAIVVYVFYKKTSDTHKIVFPLGFGYTKIFQESIALQKAIKKTRVSLKMTVIIISIEVILGISVALFMIALFPDMKKMLIESVRNGSSVLPTISTGETDPEDFIAWLENMNYVFDSSTITYDIKMILLMLCVGVPLGGFANYYTKSTIGTPIGHMSDFMYDFANADDEKKLEVASRVDDIRVNSKDEIEVLASYLKSTIHSIEDYIDKLKEDQKLQTELEVAQKSSEAKSSFLSNMSHEIRTPINAILGMNEMILRQDNDPEILEYAMNIKSAGNSLLSIINDILDFSKIEAGKMDILPVNYNLSSMINDLVNMISVRAEGKGLDINVNVDENIPDQLEGDEVRIKQCVTNILTNAVKYTEQGSVKMNVTYKEADDNNIYLRFTVSDTGIGIKEEDLNKLFSPFERIEETRNRTIEGTGLGMSIVKKLLAMMDTKLEVKSVYGEGSEFSFEIIQKVVNREAIGDFKKRYKEYIKGLKKYHEKYHAPDAKVLVVDDTPMNLTVVKGLLKATRIQVDTADSGKETLKKVQEQKYDIIFIDHRMPEMDGLETLAAMKELEGNLNEGVPCIALTANAGLGAREEYINAGFDDYIAKPINSELLESMIRNYLPDEKILEADEKDNGEDTDKGSDDASTSLDADDPLRKIQGIDLTEAIKNCGSIEVLREVINNYYSSIDKEASNIESFVKDKDFRNYTVTVHALKSSSRLIGAMELSKMAAYLEKCGNDENEDEIVAKTFELLELYRSYKEKLGVAVEEVPEDEVLPEIPEDELVQAFSDIKELIEAYDYDTADGIIKMLSGYSIKGEYKDKYDKVKELIIAVDRESLLSIL